MSGPPLSRRTAVLGAGLLSVVAAGALGGCDLDLRSTPAPAAAPPPDPDERILTAGRAELTALVARIRATRGGSSRAGHLALLGELEQAHLTQLDALGGSPPSASAAARALRPGPLLVAREQLAAARFATWADRAESGDLARVLAATSAGIATYLSGLPDVASASGASDESGPSGVSGQDPVSTDLDALQQTLAGEHAAVHAFGTLAGRAAPRGPASFRAALAAAYDVHLARRDELRRLVTAQGGDPVAADPSYLLPPGLTTRAEIEGEALRTERACLELYAALVAAGSPGPVRSWAVAALGQSALTSLGFGAEPEPLPGVTVTPEPGPGTASPSATAPAS